MESSKTAELNLDHDQQANFELIDLVAAEEEEDQMMQDQDMQDQEDQSQNVRMISIQCQLVQSNLLKLKIDELIPLFGLKPTVCDECEANNEKCAKLQMKNYRLRHKLYSVRERIDVLDNTRMLTRSRKAEIDQQKYVEKPMTTRGRNAEAEIQSD